MLIEYRAYTLRPGQLQAFVEAQALRGFDPASRPIMARLIGYFVECFGTTDRLVHLWRFDDYDDWITRLHRPDPARDAYFKIVRPLMLAQENRFMLPAPVPALTPLWGNGNDWLPDQPAPLLGSATDARFSLTTTQLFPGQLPAYWEACRAQRAALAAGGPTGPDDPDPDRAADGRLLATFYTLVGAQHQVTALRHHPGAAALARWQQASATQAVTAAFDERIRALVASRTTVLLRPVTVAAMSPLFGPA